MSTKTIHTLSPAFQVIERLGGKSTVAAELQLSPSTVSRWCQPMPGGTGGTIPQRWWPLLMALAAKQRVTLSLSDLVSMPDL